MPYASAILTSQSDSTILLGAVTDNDGRFEIKNVRQGNYQLKMSFVGFESVIFNDIALEKGTNDVGKVRMQVLAENLEDVTVTSEKSPFTYKVDRKVINVSSFPEANVGMDLLENIPSLQVDFEGKLTYRGDGTFKIFINGNPTFQGEEKLRQIPASRIEQIEVITNPSAKYDAEGTAGIIHVILKKNRLEGYQISTGLMVDTREGYQWTLSVDKKRDKGGWHLLWRYGDDVHSDYDYTRYREVYQGNQTFVTDSKKSRKGGALSSFLVWGFNRDLSEKDYLDLSFFLQPIQCKNYYDEDWTISEYSLLDGMPDNEVAYSRMHTAYDMTYAHWGSALTYKRAFDKKRRHALSAHLKLTGYLMDMEKKQKDTRIFSDETVYDGYQNKEKDELDVLAKVDYKRPLGEKSSMESGVSFNSEKIPVIETRNLVPLAGEPLNQNVDYRQDIYSAYAVFKQKPGKFRYQVSARIEHTDRKVDYRYTFNNNKELIPDQESFTDFFPSLHLMYDLGKGMEVSSGYSRRIQRPDYWQLIPIKVYASPFLYKTGNSSLQPAYSDAYDVNIKKSWNKDFVALEGFYRRTEKVIQSYVRSMDQNILVSVPENVGTSYSYGVELMTGVDLFKWWNTNLSTSLYAYQLDVNIDQVKKTEDQLKADSRLNNTFKLPHAFRIKWDIRYNSPTVKAQTSKDGYAYSNLSLNKSINDRKWRVTINWHNVFNTYQYDYSASSEYFYETGQYTSQPYVSFKVTYLFDNQK